MALCQSWSQTILLTEKLSLFPQRHLMIHDISSVERHILVRNSVYIPFSMLHDRQGEFKSLLNLLQANTKGTDQNVRIRAVFNLSKSNYAIALLLHCYGLWLAKKSHATFSTNQKLKPKSIVTCLHAFSRAWRQLHVFASSSDWFIGLFTTDVISQSNYFGFDVTTLNWKSAL